MNNYAGNYIKGDRIDKITDLIVGKRYILVNNDHDTTFLVQITESAVNSKERVERVTYNIINPETLERGVRGINDFDFTLWDFNLENKYQGTYSHSIYRAISPARNKRTFAVIVSYGIRWYGANSNVTRVFFAKRNPADYEDSSANFYYRNQISTSSVLRLLRVIERNKYPLAYAPVICGPRLWDKDMPDDEGVTPYCRMPSVDLSYDVPS